jgi:hypothetical protein
MAPPCFGRVLLFALAMSGCVGTVTDSAGASAPPTQAGPSGTSTGAGAPTGGSALLPSTGGGCQELAPPVTAARRLTRVQYANTLRDLVGDGKGMAAAQLPADDAGDDAFADPRTLIVSPDWAASAMNGAEAAAKVAVGNLATLLPCEPAGNEQLCARQFVSAFGKRAFRRPLDPAEVDGLMKVYALGAASGFAHGFELVVRTILQAPSFLYRLELGQRSGSSGSAVRLTPYEVASRLSYLFWGTMPDAALMAAADGGKLGTPDEVVAQARRMLADPRAHATLADFHGRWLGIEGLDVVSKDPMRYPQFDEQLVASMRTELALFVDDLLSNGDGRLESLFSAHHTFVDARLAPLYKVPAPAAGQFARVDLDPAQRAGILTSAGLISAHTFADESEPIHRGKFVRERLLCTTPPDPPPDLMVMPPSPTPGVSTRQRLVEHAATPSCQACHQLMDPIGFGFEAYDGLGRFRTADSNGQPIDDQGMLAMTDSDGPFKGAIELGRKLAGSAQVRACLITTALQFARGPGADGDRCLQQKLTAAFDGAKHDIRELFIAIARSEGFGYRRAIDGEVLP